MADVEGAAMASAAAGGVGGMIRIALALQAGQRNPWMLAIDGFLGFTIGVVAAGIAVWVDADLHNEAWAVLKIAGAGGAAAALGTRLLDITTAWLQRKVDKS